VEDSTARMRYYIPFPFIFLHSTCFLRDRHTPTTRPTTKFSTGWVSSVARQTDRLSSAQTSSPNTGRHPARPVKWLLRGPYRPNCYDMIGFCQDQELWYIAQKQAGFSRNFLYSHAEKKVDEWDSKVASGKQIIESALQGSFETLWVTFEQERT